MRNYLNMTVGRVAPYCLFYQSYGFQLSCISWNHKQIINYSRLFYSKIKATKLCKRYERQGNVTKILVLISRMNQNIKKLWNVQYEKWIYLPWCYRFCLSTAFQDWNFFAHCWLWKSLRRNQFSLLFSMIGHSVAGC